MKVLLTLVLTICWLTLCAQEKPELKVYTYAPLGYQLTYPASWQVQPNNADKGVAFRTGEGLNQAQVILTSRLLPRHAQRTTSWLASGQQDSVWQHIQRLPQSRVVRLDQQNTGRYEEVRYHYTYAPAPAPAALIRVMGRLVWRGGTIYTIEYRGAATQAGRILAEGEQLVTSFDFVSQPVSTRYPLQLCDDKMYGIAALRIRDDLWEDDCRTIHEFSNSDLTAPPKIHRQVLPFQSYALAKGFDNCLYSVTKAPTNTPEYVYRYNPATHKGRYTSWRLPAQGPEKVWISAATDKQGDLYFMTSDASRLVKVRPSDSTVTTVWASDPMRQTPFYKTIGFAGAGSHGNFCLDDGRTLYQVYSTDGSLLTVDLETRKAAPELIPLAGLPERGGYSDLLLQKDKDGARRLYLAGPKAVYQVDLDQRQATQVRRGIYTDLAGCNLFRDETLADPTPASPSPPTTATWRGRVLDAVTFQPLPQARLRLGPAGAETTVALSAQGAFAFLVDPGHSSAAHVQQAGYLPLDSTYTTLRGPYVQDILLQPLAIGTTLRLQNVQFEQGSSRLLNASFPALKKLLHLLTENQGLVIELRGHTDNVGSPEKNVTLSQKRVAAVKSYLVRHGISETRITGVGLGGAEPIASNARESTRQLNRRVEFRVTGI